MAATALTSDQLAQAKVQLAAAKVAAVQPVIDALNGAGVTSLKALLTSAQGVLDPTDAMFADVGNLANVLNLMPANLTTKLAPLQAIASPPPSPAAGS